jgi:hypothetical protein
MFVISYSVVHNKLSHPSLTNTSFVHKYVNYRQKSFIILAPGDNGIKLFMAVIYKWS